MRRLAKAAGGVTAMHDATEGGVIGGLFEIADASGVGMDIDEYRFVYPPRSGWSARRLASTR